MLELVENVWPLTVLLVTCDDAFISVAILKANSLYSSRIFADALGTSFTALNIDLDVDAIFTLLF